MVEEPVGTPNAIELPAEALEDGGLEPVPIPGGFSVVAGGAVKIYSQEEAARVFGVFYGDVYFIAFGA